MNRPTRSRPGPRRIAARTTPAPRLRPRLDPTKLAAGIFVTVIVCSLIGAGLGTAVFDGMGTGDEPLDVQEESGAFERTLRDAVEQDPNDVVSMVALANLLGQTGRLPEAISWYERALALEPDDWERRLDFAQTLADGGMRADAEVQFLKVLAAQPNNERAHFSLAELYRSWQPPRSDEAVHEYVEVVRLAPDSFVADRAREELRALGRPVGTPEAPPAATADGR